MIERNRFLFVGLLHFEEYSKCMWPSPKHQQRCNKDGLWHHTPTFFQWFMSILSLLLQCWMLIMSFHKGLHHECNAAWATLRLLYKSTLNYFTFLWWFLAAEFETKLKIALTIFEQLKTIKTVFDWENQSFEVKIIYK